LYDELVAQGSASLVDALQVGATVEDLDIFDLENLLQDADNQDVRIVFLNLIKGSRNHLRSFASQLSKNGSSYEAQYISRDYLSRILESSQETGSIQDPWFQF
jgi:rubrerythrin